MGPRRRRDSGFTLIELECSVLIISVLASISTPQYVKVVERARLAEAQAFVASVKRAQEFHLARFGGYLTHDSGLGRLDISLDGAAPRFGMRYFSVALGPGAEAVCPAGEPNYSVTLTRVRDVADVAPRYPAGYTVVFDRCSGTIRFPDCPSCAEDFAQ